MIVYDPRWLIVLSMHVTHGEGAKSGRSRYEWSLSGQPGSASEVVLPWRAQVTAPGLLLPPAARLYRSVLRQGAFSPWLRLNSRTVTISWSKLAGLAARNKLFLLYP